MHLKSILSQLMQSVVDLNIKSLGEHPNNFECMTHKNGTLKTMEDSDGPGWLFLKQMG